MDPFPPPGSRKSAGRLDLLLESPVAWRRRHTRSLVSWATVHCRVAARVSGQQGSRGVFQDFAIELLPAASAGLTRAPVTACGRVAVVWIGPEEVVEIVGVLMGRQNHLASVVHAEDALGLGFGFGQGRQKHAGKDGDNGNHYQQLDQREAGMIAPAGARFDIHKHVGVWTTT